MPRLDYKICKACGRHADEAGPLSHARLCAACGDSRNKRAALEQHNHNGEYFERWRRRIAASVGAVVLDDYRSKP